MVRNHHGTLTISIEFSAAITHCSDVRRRDQVARHQPLVLAGQVQAGPLSNRRTSPSSRNGTCPNGCASGDWSRGRHERHGADGVRQPGLLRRPAQAQVAHETTGPFGHPVWNPDRGGSRPSPQLIACRRPPGIGPASCLSRERVQHQPHHRIHPALEAARVTNARRRATGRRPHTASAWHPVLRRDAVQGRRLHVDAEHAHRVRGVEQGGIRW